jgi:N-acetylneuraminic acid mutarotase
MKTSGIKCLNRERKLKFYFLILPFFLGACTEIDVIPITTWKQLADFPGSPRASATSFVYGVKAFVCLGRSEWGYGFLNDLWEYDSTTDTWTRKTDFPGKARVKAIGGVIGNKAYVGLGDIAPYNGNQFSDFWEYDINKDTWKQLASFPGEAKTDLFCGVVDSCIYVTDGFTATGFNQDTWKYIPKTNSWTRLSKYPRMCSSVAGFSIGQNLYVGTGYQSGNLKDFYSYNTLTDKWSRLSDAPEGRILSKGIAINGKGYILLGRYWDGMLDGGKLLKDVIEYDPLTNKWTRCGDFPGGARQNPVAFAINGKGYVVGGEDNTERKSDVWVFTP